MEQYLGRELTKEETVDHINNDFTDDRIDNLQLLSLRDNVLKSKIGKEAIMYSFSCLCCGKEAVRELYKVERNWKLGRSGPYCGKQCAGKATYVNPWVTK